MTSKLIYLSLFCKITLIDQISTTLITLNVLSSVLSLYSTATQNHSRKVLLRHLTQNPQRKLVKYRLRWVPKSSRWPCTFHVVCVSFICVRWPTQTQFSVEYGLKCFNVSLRSIVWLNCNACNDSLPQPSSDVTLRCVTSHLGLFQTCH